MATIELTYTINIERPDHMTNAEFLEWIDQNMYEAIETGIGLGNLEHYPVIELDEEDEEDEEDEDEESIPWPKNPKACAFW